MTGEMKRDLGEPVVEDRFSIVDGSMIPGGIMRITFKDLSILMPNITLQTERPLTESKERNNPSGIPDF